MLLVIFLNIIHSDIFQMFPFKEDVKIKDHHYTTRELRETALINIFSNTSMTFSRMSPFFLLFSNVLLTCCSILRKSTINKRHLHEGRL